jgi:hypothetical protein
MAEPGLFFWLFMGMDEKRTSVSTERSAMKTGVSCVALCFGLFTATIIALAQTTSPTFLAQGPSSAPPSGVVAAPPAAPVSVPPSGVLATPPSAQRPVTPSGVLATAERHRVSKARPIKTAQNVRHQRSKPATMRRHVVHHWTAPRHDKGKPPTILARNIAPAPSVDSSAAEAGRSFLSQFGKAKEPAQ